MAPEPLRARAPLHVAIVSRNPETVEGLESYLHGVGIVTSSSRLIDRAAELGAVASAVVLFPDDYEWEAAVAALSSCRRRNPRTLPVLVTRTPQRFESLAGPEGGALPLLVPRPSWSWTILDAIRAHLDEQELA
jgi:hypothetical protein